MNSVRRHLPSACNGPASDRLGRVNDALVALQPSLSVLIPNYNHARYLPEVLEAILAQSYCPAEIIVTDDASTDNSVEVVKGFARENALIRLVRNEENMGAVLNANRLLELASGDYVCFAAADDKVLPGFFEKTMRLLERYPQAGLCSGLTLMIDENGKEIGLYQSPIISNQAIFLSPKESLRALQLHGGWMVGSATIFKRQALMDIGGFKPELGPFVDGLTQQIIALRHGVCFIPEPMTCWRRMETGYSINASLNVELYLERVEQMKRLLGTTYRDLFPPEYVAQQEREWLYGAGVGAARSLQQSHVAYIERLRRVLSPPNLFDRGVLSALQWAMSMQIGVATGYLFLRRRRITGELLRRRMVWVLEKVRTRFGGERVVRGGR